MRIGILGGTYDPIHNGHLALARALVRELKLDLFYFVPSSISPAVQGEKSATAPASVRFEMVRKSIEAIPQFSVSDFELKRGGVSYTIDTVREFRKQYPEPNELFLIVGGDWGKSLQAWKEMNKIESLAQLVVATRPGFEAKSLPNSVRVFQFDAIDISSSQIRELIRQKKSVADWVPKLALEIIQKNNLYQT